MSHVPVMVKEVLSLLSPRAGETVVDATIGLGGHARLLAELLGPSGRLIGLDVDPQCLDAAREHLAGLPCRIDLVARNFSDLGDVLAQLAVERVNVILADLGLNSAQLDQAHRGFSFQREGPLDMRMDPQLSVTAADFVNRLKERELADLIYENSQEPASRRIARRICEVRRDGRITTTGKLAAVVCDALGMSSAAHPSKIHPATRTFQALRMAVNSELKSLSALLDAAPGLLAAGGRFGVIAFHSLEDKPVKLDFRNRKAENVYSLATAKPVVADEDERAANPRSRSAKLRVAERTYEVQGG